MRKLIFSALLSVCLVNVSHAQIALSKAVGKNSDQYKMGYGAFLEFGIPVKTGSDVVIEGGVNIFSDKADAAYGFINCPLKVGYRYKVNHTDKGFYVQPTVGYNVYGLYDYPTYDEYGYKRVGETKFHGLILSPTVGYLFTVLKTDFNIKAYYETNLLKDGHFSYAGINLSHTFSFRKKKSED